MSEALLTPTRPVMRYHGGKWRLAPWIISYFPEHRIYVEPYGGAASVLMQKRPCYAEVYNDANGEIVNVFRVLRDPEMGEALRRDVYFTPFAREEFALSYEPSDNPVEQARRTILRSYMGFGSAAHNSRIPTGFRANSNRSGTTPAHDWVNYVEAIPMFVARLQGVVIEHRPALEIIQQHDGPETLFYCDPPYPHETRKNRQAANYGEYEMTKQDHAALAEALHGIEGMAIVSGYACEMYDHLYGDWESVSRATYADGARPRVETLWLSPRVSQERRQPVLL